MTPNERIDAALDNVLKASGSALKNYTRQLTLDQMREAMRKVMSDSYIAGSNDNFDAMKKARHNAPHEGPGAASSRTVPLDAVVGPRGPERTKT